MSSAKKKTLKNINPIDDAITVLRKHQSDFMAMIEKESKKCTKEFDSLKNKKKKLADAKTKASSRKKDTAAKVKAKSTAANKKQLDKANIALKTATDNMILINEQLENTKLRHIRITSLVKQYQAEEKLVAKFRKDQEKAAAKKIVKKKKPKAKVKTPVKNDTSVEVKKVDLAEK